MALKGRSTRRTLRIFTTEIALELQGHAGLKRRRVLANQADFDTNWRKKETSETLTTSRSSKLNQFLQKEPWWRNAPWTVICNGTRPSAREGGAAPPHPRAPYL